MFTGRNIEKGLSDRLIGQTCQRGDFLEGESGCGRV